METVICFFSGYAAGMLNPSYVISRIKGFDIRKKGSGNAGGSNALITMGKTVGVFCILFDIFKAYMVISLMRRIYSVECAASFFSTFAGCITGHIFPVYLGFRGGKGLACLAGGILAYDWRVFLAILGAELLILVFFDYICIVPVTASFIFAAVYGFSEKNLPGTAVLILIFLVILSKHFENFRRIKLGREYRIRFLWKPDTEKARVEENYGVTEKDGEKK